MQVFPGRRAPHSASNDAVQVGCGFSGNNSEHHLRRQCGWAGKGAAQWGSCFLAILLAASVTLATDVPTYHNNNSRTGQNPAETILTTGNVNSTTFGKLFTMAVDGVIDAQPLYLS